AQPDRPEDRVSIFAQVTHQAVEHHRVQRLFGIDPMRLAADRDVPTVLVAHVDTAAGRAARGFAARFEAFDQARTARRVECVLVDLDEVETAHARAFAAAGAAYKFCARWNKTHDVAMYLSPPSGRLPRCVCVYAAGAINSAPVCGTILRR